jgi:serine/threonine protein kinase
MDQASSGRAWVRSPSKVQGMLAERSLDYVVDGRFVVRELRHRGTRSELYVAYDQTSGERVALKVVRAGGTSPERFAREAQTLTRLWHPGITRHLAHGTTSGGAPYVVMEWLEGEDLAERLRRERLGVAEVVTLGIALARALDAAHTQGLVHRDLKPGNVLLEGFRPASAKLLDFGLGWTHGAVRELARPRASLAARGYVAPEQILGDPLHVGPRADLFSLGCILYEALTDRPAFEVQAQAQPQDHEEVLRRILFVDPEPLAARAPGLPAGLASLVEWLLSKDPENRPLGAAAVASALEAVPVSTRRDGVRLSVLRGTDFGTVRVLGEARMDLGRHPSATLPLRDAAIARFHCEIARSEDGVLVAADLGSAHGLEVDGERVTRAELHDGAVLTIGHALVRVERVPNADCGPTGLELARSGDMNVLLEGPGDPRVFAERLHGSGGRRRGPYAAVYGSALRIRDLAHLSGGTLLLLEPETLTPEGQHELADFAETRMVPTSRGRAHADVRLVAHPAIDLRLAVNGRRFLPDLFQALAGIRVAS